MDIWYVFYPRSSGSGCIGIVYRARLRRSNRQWVQYLGAQCSGTLILARLGLLDGVPACTDLITKPWVEEAGVQVLNQPFYANGRVAVGEKDEYVARAMRNIEPYLMHSHAAA